MDSKHIYLSKILTSLKSQWKSEMCVCVCVRVCGGGGGNINYSFEVYVTCRANLLSSSGGEVGTADK